MTRNFVFMRHLFAMDSSASTSLQQEDVQLQVANKLRADSVKLWLQPYYSQIAGPNPDLLKELAQTYAESLNIPLDQCYETLCKLQSTALEKLKENDRFKESGLATIKIKVLTQGRDSSRMLTKELMLSMRVCDLKDIISKEINVTQDRIKLIYAGKVLNDLSSLMVQGVKHGQKMIAITLAETPTEVQNKETAFIDLEKFKTDSRLLAGDSEYMQVEDQFGNAIKIPDEERKALTMAMALHAKGQAAMKKEDYSRALVFFLEADEEYKRCNAQILDSVDNYALVNLDIAWCYLCIESAAHLPEAFERLKKCEERFHKSYGPNLERLMAVKGATGNEAALFMRLHLLQAIALYHKNKRTEALALLEKAQRELIALRVDENSLLMLVELGFTTAEARLGLRANNGDVNLAANYIKENRDKRVESRKRAMADEILEKKRKKLGKCADGKQYVEPNFLNILVNMGYNKEAARIALRECNNIITNSVQYMQEHPQPGPSQSKSSEFLALVEDLIPELEGAGFDPRMAKLALFKHNGDIMKAAEDLVTNNGVIEGDYSLLNTPPSASQPSSSSQAGGSSKDFSVGADSIEDIRKKNEEKEQAFKRLAEDITMVDDDHLDLTLDQEETYLQQYMSLLKKE